MLAPFLLMTLTRKSGCKINLLLNILGKRADGFHELETVLQPVPLSDELSFARAGTGVQLTCNVPELPTDANNLVVRAAEAFLEAAAIREGVKLHLEKRIPVAAGLGGGSGNAAATLLGLNELFGGPLSAEQLHRLAATLGSDVPFFLQDKPAIATGRGERVTPVEPFSALRGASVLLIHPGFGISTAWAYQQLARFPASLSGTQGRADKLVALLRNPDLRAAGNAFYNSLEAPALHKYPLLALFQELLRDEGAAAVLMSGSGSTTFALTESSGKSNALKERFVTKFGPSSWIVEVSLG